MIIFLLTLAPKGFWASRRINTIQIVRSPGRYGFPGALSQIIFEWKWSLRIPEIAMAFGPACRSHHTWFASLLLFTLPRIIASLWSDFCLGLMDGTCMWEVQRHRRYWSWRINFFLVNVILFACLCRVHGIIHNVSKFYYEATRRLFYFYLTEFDCVQLFLRWNHGVVFMASDFNEF